jgi:tetratricopeptide (TPR) repeat protein
MDLSSYNLSIIIDEQLDEYDMTPTTVYIQRLEKALALDPENTDSLNNIGVHYLDGMKDPQTAETYFRRALAIDPNQKESRHNVLTAIRRQDPLFRFLYFPLDKGVMLIVRFFQICWAKKWPIIFLLFAGKYLVVLGAGIFILWCVLFYPLIFAYRWMTLIDLRRKSNDLSLKLPAALKPFFRLPKTTRMACFFGLWVLIWSSLAIVQAYGTSGELFLLLVIACVVLVLSFVWIQSFIQHRATNQT